MDDNIITLGGTMPDMAEVPEEAKPKIGKEKLLELNRILQKYKAGKVRTERRIISAENWWKMRNGMEENSAMTNTKDWHSVSGWLHNVIVTKHADALDSFPEPNILPREQGDRAEAMILSSVIPCILEQCRFEDIYSDVMWQKLKTGTGVYKVIWDSGKLNGLGDIGIEQVNILNLYWEPGITDLEKSRYLFHTELIDIDLLEERYPQIKGKVKANEGFVQAKFLYDDTVDTENKATVIDVYYHKMVGSVKTLQYIKYVGDEILDCTENDPEMAERGLYDHGRYPYVMDSLYPIEGSPVGYGFVDLCKHSQQSIDMLNTAFIRNAMVGATPRYFAREDGSINEEEFLDVTKPLIHVSGNMGQDSLRIMEYKSLDGNYLNLINMGIQELRETSGNTETANGSTPSGVTAASAIAALQEASGKGSRDATHTAYRAFTEIVSLCIELIRQFYDLPRQFRILGQYGQQQFIKYSNEYLQPQAQGSAFGVDQGYRLPVFDIKVSAQKKSTYTKVSQNELAIQMYQLGVFSPQNVDQALSMLEIMDFDGKDQIMQKVSQQGTMYDKLTQYMQMALTLAQVTRPDLVPGLAQDIQQTLGAAGASMTQGVSANLAQTNALTGQPAEEHALVQKARARANEAVSPDGGAVTGAAKG